MASTIGNQEAVDWRVDAAEVGDLGMPEEFGVQVQESVAVSCLVSFSSPLLST